MNLRLFFLKKQYLVKLILTFQKADFKKHFNLGNNKSFRSDIFIKENITENVHINFIIEIKQTQEFNDKWIYNFRELQLSLKDKENPCVIIVSNTLPKGIERFGQVKGIFVCKVQEIYNVIDFAKQFHSEFMLNEEVKKEEETINDEFTEPVVNFLESQKINIDLVSQILFPFFLVKILDSIFIKDPRDTFDKNSSNIDPRFYKFLRFRTNLFDNPSFISFITTTLNILKPRKIIKSFAEIYDGSILASDDEISDLILNIFHTKIYCYEKELQKLLLESDIFKALKILIEKNILLDFLSLVDNIKFNDPDNLKNHLFSEYHKIHHYSNRVKKTEFNHTMTSKADLMSVLLLNYDEKIVSKEESWLNVDLRDTESIITVFESGKAIFRENIDRGIQFLIREVEKKFYLSHGEALLLINTLGLLDENGEDMGSLDYDHITLDGVNNCEPTVISPIEYSELICQILRDIIDELITKVPEKIIEKFSDHNSSKIYEHVILDTTDFYELDESSGGFYIGYEDERKYVRFKKHYVSTLSYNIYDPACGSFNLTSSLSNIIFRTFGLRSHITGNDIKSNKELLNNLFLSLITNSNILFNSVCSLTPKIDSEEFIENNDDNWHFLMCDPPISYNWSNIQDKITFDSLFNQESPYFYGLPDINDGEILFLQHMISKINYKKQQSRTELEESKEIHEQEIETRSRIGIFLKNDLLYSNRGNLSKIRSHIIENDLLDSIVKLPSEMNDSRSIWILDNDKDKERIGKIELVDLDKYDSKNKELLSMDYLNELIKEISDINGEQNFSKSIKNKELGFYEIIVEDENNQFIIEKIKITSGLNESTYTEIEKKISKLKSK